MCKRIIVITLVMIISDFFALFHLLKNNMNCYICRKNEAIFIDKKIPFLILAKNGVFDCLAITSVICDVIDYGNIAILCYLKFKTD